MKLAVIGAGNMARALVRGALDGGILSADELTLCRRDPERLAEAVSALGGNGTTNAAEAVAGSDMVLFAVKPQQAIGALEALAPALSHGPVLLSVLAGTKTASLEAAGGGRLPVVRCMPNTPAFVGEGMAPLCAGQYVSDAQVAMAQSFLEASGKVLRVDEAAIDGITAVSGCGPAYVFLMAEAMRAGAKALGVGDAAAELLVEQTLFGAAAYLRASELDPATLRRQVTSPGGATAEAIATFQAGGFEDLVARAMAAARDRAQELGG